MSYWVIIFGFYLNYFATFRSKILYVVQTYSKLRDSRFIALNEGLKVIRHLLVGQIQL